MDLGFNVMDYAPGNASETESKEYTLATPGKYKVEIIDSSEEISGAGNRYLKLKLSIMEGTHKGTWVWDNLNLYHPKEDVQGLARQILGTISKSCGIIGPKDTSELHYKPLFALLDVEPEGDYPAKNVVKKYSPLDPGTVKEAAVKVTKIQLDKISALPNKEGDAPVVDSEPQKDGIPF
jgi:hypothetical protein